MPALKAARTALTCPRVKGTSAISTFRRFLVARDCICIKLGRTNRWRKGCKSVSMPCGILPRRFISSSVAIWSKSNSPSLKCLTALRRFLGRTCRCVADSVVASAAGNFVGGAAASRTASVEKRSGVGCSAGVRPMPIIMPTSTLDGNQSLTDQVHHWNCDRCPQLGNGLSEPALGKRPYSERFQRYLTH